MKFSIGDRILLKRTGEEGRVIAFLSPTMMEVEVDGIHFPVYNEEVDHPYLKWFTEKKPQRQKAPVEIPVEKAKTRTQRLPQGIYLSFMPQFAVGIDDEIELFKIHFINETPEHIFFSYYAKDAAGATLFQHRASLHAFGHVYLHPLSLEAMNEQPRFHWMLEVNGAKDPPASGILRIRPLQLVRFIHDMMQDNQPGFSVLLATDAAPPALPETHPELLSGISVGTAGTRDWNNQVTMETTADEVIDLHIQTIPHEGKGLTPDEILQIQLSFLQRKVQAAMAGGLEQMIIIHGLGKGTLRQRVHEMLSTIPGISQYSNHWMSGYGWGATQVIFGR